MELIYSLIFLISCLIEDIDNVLLKKTNIKAFKYEKILHVSEEPSLLQCAQRCRFIDKNSIVDFKNSKCTCIKYEGDEGQEHQRTLTGVFVNQKLMKAKKLELPRSTKPPQSTKPASRVMNVALNKIAQQSTNYYPSNMGAKYAIDGSESSHSATKIKLNQWWSVDLKTTTDIIYIVLKGAHVGKYGYNRALIVETSQKESGAWITCRNIGDLKVNALNFTCDYPTNARYVKIKSMASCMIEIKEFEIYARVTV